MAYLRHYLNGNTVSMYEIKGTVVLGRHPDCGITIDDPTVSSEHARLTLTNTESTSDKDSSAAEITCELVDLESTNGIRSGGQKVERTILKTGTVFSIGTHEFEYLITLPNNLERTLKIKKSWIPGVYFTE